MILYFLSHVASPRSMTYFLGGFKLFADHTYQVNEFVVIPG